MRPFPIAVGIAAAAFVMPLQAADLEAGKAKAQAVCAACHGANGVSVSDSIPNLAGQRSAYLEAQLKAWKDGSRKNPLMNAIGAQLGADEMANLAAYFASLPGAGGAAKSELMPALARSPIVFPEGYRASYTKYLTVDTPATKQVRYYYANPTAVQAARAGKALPDGSMLLVEVNSAKLDAEKKPVTGADGHFMPDQLVAYTAMAREAGWGDAVPDLLRNENWSYALFSAAKQQRTGVNQAECLACHKPQDKVSYLFTLDKLAAAVR
jgi:cytochrome c553